MTRITVAWVKEREGKWHGVKDTNDKWYSFEHAKYSFVKGKSYDVDVVSTDREGKTYYTIATAKEASGSAGSGNGGSVDRWWMPFVSNTVAHAIAAAQITEPGMIKLWAAAAKEAALEIEKPAPRDDDLPEF